MAASRMLNWWWPSNKMINIAVIGKTGTGKSASCNTLLCTDTFSESHRATSCTQLCAQMEGDVGGTQIKVIDTPGNFDTSIDGNWEDLMNPDSDAYARYKEKLKVVSLEIARAVTMAADGVDTFFLTIRPDVRLTMEERDAINQFSEIFEEADKYIILCLTHGDYLRGTVARRLGITNQDPVDRMYEAADHWIREQEDDEFLNSLLNRVKHRYIVLDNELARDDETARCKMVERAMNEVQNLCSENNFTKYSNSFFDTVRNVMSAGAGIWSWFYSGKGSKNDDEHLRELSKLILARLLQIVLNLVIVKVAGKVASNQKVECTIQ